MKKTFVAIMAVLLLASVSSTATAGPMPRTCLKYKLSTAENYAGESVIEAVEDRILRTEVYVDTVDKKKGRVCFKQLKPMQYPSYIFAFRIAGGSVAGYIWTPHLHRWLRVTLPPMWLTT